MRNHTPETADGYIGRGVVGIMAYSYYGRVVSEWKNSLWHRGLGYVEIRRLGGIGYY